MGMISFLTKTVLFAQTLPLRATAILKFSMKLSDRQGLKFHVLFTPFDSGRMHNNSYKRISRTNASFMGPGQRGVNNRGLCRQCGLESKQADHACEAQWQDIA